MPPPPSWDCSRYRPATRRPGRVMGRRVTVAGTGGGSDGGRDPEPARVLLLGAGRESVVEVPELGVHLGGEVVEDLLPRGRLVVAASQQQLPRLRLAIALATLGQELREVGVLRRRLLRRRGTRRQVRGVAAPEDADDRVDHFRPHLARLAHVPASSQLAPYADHAVPQSLPRRLDDQPPGLQDAVRRTVRAPERPSVT